MLPFQAANLDAFSSATLATSRAGVGVSTILRAQDSRLSADFDQTLRSKHALSSPRDDGSRRVREPSDDLAATGAEARNPATDDDRSADAAADVGDTDPASGPADAVEGSPSPQTPAESGSPTEAGPGAPHAVPATIAADAAIRLAGPTIQADTQPVTIHTLNEQLLRGLVGTSRPISASVPSDVRPEQSAPSHPADPTQGGADDRVRDDASSPTRVINHDEVGGSPAPAAPMPDAHDPADTGRSRPNALGDAATQSPTEPRRGEHAAVADARTAGPSSIAASTQGAAASARVGERASPASESRPVADRAAVAAAAGRPVAASGSAGRQASADGRQASASSTHAASTNDGEPASPITAQLARGLSAAIARVRTTGAGGEGLADRTHELTLRLQPASLGRVRIHVAFNAADGKVSARFEVGSRGTRAQVAESLEELRSSLQQRGLSIERMDVTIDRSLASAAPSSADPLGLLFGTPNAESPSARHAAVDPDRAAVDPDARGSRHGESGHEHSGPEARHEQGQGSTDAPSLPPLAGLAGEDQGDARSAASTHPAIGLDHVAERLAERLAPRLRGDRASAAASPVRSLDAVA